MFSNGIHSFLRRADVRGSDDIIYRIWRILLVCVSGIHVDGGAEIARPDNSAPDRKGGHRETGQRGTRLNRSQRVEHPLSQEKIERAER